jgi:hypothetical protein
VCRAGVESLASMTPEPTGQRILGTGAQSRGNLRRRQTAAAGDCMGFPCQALSGNTPSVAGRIEARRRREPRGGWQRAGGNNRRGSPGIQSKGCSGTRGWPRFIRNQTVAMDHNPARASGGLRGTGDRISFWSAPWASPARTRCSLQGFGVDDQTVTPVLRPQSCPSDRTVPTLGSRALAPGFKGQVIHVPEPETVRPDVAGVTRRGPVDGSGLGPGP